MSEESRNMYFEIERSAQAAALSLKMTYYGGKQILKLLQFMMRLFEKGILSKSDFEDFKTFMKLTKGNFTNMAIPIDLRGITQEEKDSLLSSVDSSMAPGISEEDFQKKMDQIGKDFKDFRDNLQGENIDKIDELIQKAKESPVSERNQILSDLWDSISNLDTVSLDDKLRELKDSLKEQGIHFCVMPGCQSENRPVVTIAIDKADTNKFMPFFQNYINNQMSGGQHRMDAIRALTNGKANLAPVHEEILGKFCEILDRQKIDYAIAPDNNLDDGIRHLVIPNDQLSMANSLYSQLRTALLNTENKDYGPFKTVPMDSYFKTSTLTTDEVMNKARKDSPEIDKALKSFEGPHAASPAEDLINGMGREPEDAESFACGQFFNNDDYVPLSVYDSLVDNPKDQILSKVQSSSPDLFCCRIPGTWGENEQILAVSPEKVFRDKQTNRYIVFMPKDESPAVLTKDGIKRDIYKNGMDLYNHLWEKNEGAFIPIKPEKLQSILQDVPKAAPVM